jgi:hypothetical protein
MASLEARGLAALSAALGRSLLSAEAMALSLSAGPVVTPFSDRKMRIGRRRTAWPMSICG